MTDPATEPTRAAPPSGERVLLAVSGLQKHFPVRRGLLQAPGRRGAGRRRPRLRRPRGRDPRPGGRVRLRQDHHRPADHPAAGADRRQDHLRGPRHHALSAGRRCGRCAATSQMIFQDPYSSLNPRHTVGTIVGAPFRSRASRPSSGVKKAVQDLLDAGRAQPRALQPLPARVLRRPAAAHRHRPHARAAAQADRRRRAGVRARRVDPGAGGQPAGGPAGRARPDLRGDRARPVGGPAHLATGSR